MKNIQILILNNTAIDVDKRVDLSAFKAWIESHCNLLAEITLQPSAVEVGYTEDGNGGWLTDARNKISIPSGKYDFIFFVYDRDQEHSNARAVTHYDPYGMATWADFPSIQDLKGDFKNHFAKAILRMAQWLGYPMQESVEPEVTLKNIPTNVWDEILKIIAPETEEEKFLKTGITLLQKAITIQEELNVWTKSFDAWRKS